MDIELCRKFFDSRRNYTIFAGFSGGADSTAALLAALHFAGEFNLKIVAVHFNHHLRGHESDADALWCRKFAEARGIDFKQIDLNIPAKHGIEDAARQARLEHWKKLIENKTRCSVMLGHHADDRIENFFLRMLRGSNLSGLLSPKAEYVLDGIEIFRPLVSFSRRDIESFLISNGISDWRIDSTNKLADCSRNQLRLNLLPKLFELFPGAYDGVCQCLRVLEQDAAYLDELASERFDLKQINSRCYWQKLPPALVVRILRLWKGEIPSAAFCERFFNELKNPLSDEPKRIPWNNNEFLLLQNDVVFWQNSNDTEVLKIWNLKEKSFLWGDWEFFAEETLKTETISKYEAVFDANLLGAVLQISLPQPGERMTVFGSSKVEKIKKLRIDSKVPAFYQLPVIRNAAGEIVWAPGVRHSALAAAQSESVKLIKLSVRSVKFGVGVGIN